MGTTPPSQQPKLSTLISVLKHGGNVNEMVRNLITKHNKMDEQLRELFKKAFNEGAMYEATLSSAYSFDSFLEDNIEQLRLYGVVSSCVDKGELISDLDDRRAGKG